MQDYSKLFYSLRERLRLTQKNWHITVYNWFNSHLESNYNQCLHFIGGRKQNRSSVVDLLGLWESCVKEPISVFSVCICTTKTTGRGKILEKGATNPKRWSVRSAQKWKISQSLTLSLRNFGPENVLPNATFQQLLKFWNPNWNQRSRQFCPDGGFWTVGGSIRVEFYVHVAHATASWLAQNLQPIYLCEIIYSGQHRLA